MHKNLTWPTNLWAFKCKPITSQRICITKCMCPHFLTHINAILLSPLSPQRVISIEKEQEHQKQQGRVGPRQEWREKSAVKIWNRKNVASVRAGDKSAALHTQTQGFCGWVTPSSPGALSIATPLLRPPAGSGPPARHPALHTADPGAWYTLTDSRGFKGIWEAGGLTGPSKRQPWETEKVKELLSHAALQLAALVKCCFISEATSF